MASPAHTPTSRAPRVALPTLLAVTVGVLAMPAMAVAEPVGSATLQDQLAAHVEARVESRADLVSERRDLRRDRRERARTWGAVSGRLDALYRAGGSEPLEKILAGESVSEVEDALDVISAVSRHDRRELLRHAALGRSVRDSEQRVDELEDEAVALTGTIARDRSQLAAALRREAEARRQAAIRAAAARAEAARLARIANPPLAPQVLSPETIEVEAAAEAEAESREGADAAPAAAPADSAGEAPPPVYEAPAPSPAGYSETGTASMYHDGLAGRPTASGEPYDPGAMTAAHPSLPLGSWVQVQGPGGTAVVRINDRGPFVGGRIIDLSRAAAGAVGVNGLATVTITVQQ